MSARETITTLCIGQRFLRVGLALMRSIQRVSGPRYRLVIFHAQTRPRLLQIPPGVELLRLEDAQGQPAAARKLNAEQRQWAERKHVCFKAAPLNDPRVAEDAVIFLDADSLVFRDVLPELFKRVRQHHFAVFGRMRADDFIWLKDKEGGGFSLKQGMRPLGLDLPNFSLNSGFIGRAPTEIGQRFAQRFEQYVQARPFAEQIRSEWHRLNDEPYLALAYIQTQAETGHGTHELPPDAYITTATATIDPAPVEPPRIRKPNGETCQCSIVHYAGKSQHGAYLRAMLPLAPLSLRGRLRHALKSSEEAALASGTHA